MGHKFNPTTGTFEEVANGNGNSSNKEHTVYYHFSGERLQRLVKIMERQGVPMNGDERKRKATIGKLAHQVIDAAVNEYLDQLDKATQAPAPEKSEQAPAKNK